MAWADDVNHVEIVLVDDSIEMDVNEIKPGCRAPMADQTRLDVFLPERFFEKRIVVKIGLSHRKIIGGPPPGVHLAKKSRVERAGKGSRCALRRYRGDCLV